PEAPRAGCGRRRTVHPRPHHPRHREGLRRLRRRQDRRRAAQPHARHLRTAAMTIKGSKTPATSAPARIRLGMVGGGEGAFIGAVHRIAARLDDHYELVAGALASTPEKAQRSGRTLGLSPERTYDDYLAMAKAEAARADGIEAVAIVTPNSMHAPV